MHYILTLTRTWSLIYSDAETAYSYSATFLPLHACTWSLIYSDAETAYSFVHYILTLTRMHLVSYLNYCLNDVKTFQSATLYKIVPACIIKANIVPTIYSKLTL